MPSIEKIRPADRTAWFAARGQDITASQIGALFNAHEFTSLYGLWAAKTGLLPHRDDETPAIRRGRLLERTAVEFLREQFPKWKIEHNASENIYYRDPAARLGGTPDVIAWAKDRGKGVVQIKSVEPSIYRHKWLDEDGNPEPPLWIALQATLEAYLVGAQWAAVAPLVVSHGVDMPLIEIPLVDGVINAMKARAAEFWQMVADKREPEADYSRDGDLIDRIYSRGDIDHEVDLTSDNMIPGLIAERREHLAEREVAQSRIDQIDAEIKLKIRDATVAHIADGRKITWRQSKRAGFFVEPKTARVLSYPTERK